MALLHFERLKDVRQELVDFCYELAAHVPWDVVILCGKRTEEEQARLYAQGRTTPGRIVTNAAHAQDSAHGRGCAVDVAPCLKGAVDWVDKSKFLLIGEFAEAHGLVWGGRWKLADLDHVEMEAWSEITSPGFELTTVSIHAKKEKPMPSIPAPPVITPTPAPTPAPAATSPTGTPIVKPSLVPMLIAIIVALNGGAYALSQASVSDTVRHTASFVAMLLSSLMAVVSPGARKAAV